MKKHITQPEGNYYDKYHSKNPIEKRMIENFFNSIKQLMSEMDTLPAKILEAGCGEGEVTHFINSVYPKAFIEAFDISEKVINNIASKSSNITFYIGDIYTMQIYKNLEDARTLSDRYDIVVCSEVLEHLEKPETAIQKLKEMSNKYILISVPNEPIWRILNMARGKYWPNLGNTPGHIQHWNKSSFCKMLKKNGLQLINIKCPLPWLIALTVKE